MYKTYSTNTKRDSANIAKITTKSKRLYHSVLTLGYKVGFGTVDKKRYTFYSIVGILTCFHAAIINTMT